MQDAVDRLVELLDLEELEVNIFRGRSPQENRQRVFGGQVAGQALVAAGRTVERGIVHSLHAYFLRPGDPAKPILYEVDRIRDGRTFTTRRVVAIQHGRAIFNLAASFQPEEKGPEHQMAMPDVADPDSLPSSSERLEKVKDSLPKEALEWLTRDRPIEVRPVMGGNPFKPTKRPPRQMVWIRANGTLPDPFLLHQCVVVYASDLTLLDTATLPHAIAWNDPSYVMASLDHAMWFHRPFRADEWLLYVQDSPSASGARGFTMGQLFTRNGILVASVAQEGLIRPVGKH
ncbi:MAG TPA: acyl-CoA thioesterase II [Candidatus Binatia bacterium]|jgi:acyl-CoA thioesterase-2|nr:acyl-CoA thioesterase II [Candidatus Binatia bacterium]